MIPVLVYDELYLGVQALKALNALVSGCANPLEPAELAPLLDLVTCRLDTAIDQLRAAQAGGEA